MTERKSLRVLMVTTSFHPIVGGSEQQVRLLATALAQREVAVTILTRRPSGASSREELGGISVIRVGWHRPGRLWSICSALLWLITIWRRRDSFDVLHAHQPYSSAIVAGVVARLTGKPAICKLPGSGNLWVFRNWRGWLLTRVVNRFVATNAEEWSKVSGFVGSRRVQVIPNGVPTGASDVRVVRREKGEILFVGRLVAIKGPRLLLEAFRHIHECSPDSQLVFVGDGCERPSLERMVATMGISHSVSFVGEVPHHAVKGYYTKASVFVNCSRHEGISNAMLEAMLHRLPIVASRIPGNTALVRQGETGLLFDSWDARGLSKSVLATLNDVAGARNRAEHAYEHVTENYGMEGVVGQYLALYEALLQEQERRPL